MKWLQLQELPKQKHEGGSPTGEDDRLSSRVGNKQSPLSCLSIMPSDRHMGIGQCKELICYLARQQMWP
eukprot:9425637-Ditylum_brightwellii.AAC.2